MVKTGLLAFCNDGGIGAQTRRLAKLLNPDLIMVINSSSFSQNVTQHYEWYDGYKYFIARGFPPTNDDVQRFLLGLTHVICVENPYNFGLVYWGQKQGTKVYCQSNYEFCDNLDKPWLPVPDKFLMPSYWKIEEMERRFGKDRVMYLPPPLDPDEFRKAREINLARTGKRRFLHVIGTIATEDRNGTLDLLEAIKKIKGDFEIVIRTQHQLTMDYLSEDERVKYELGNRKDNAELYVDFDALILPRRWGGLSLTANEALMSGLPVIMTDISPNNEWLPEDWLVRAEVKGNFPARSQVDFYSADYEELAKKIDWFIQMSKAGLQAHKELAFNLAYTMFSPEVLKPKYLDLFNQRES